MKKRLVFTVTNDLSYDQRMIRICTSLTNAGYEVTLIGHQKKKSIPLQQRPYRQKRLSTLSQKGILFYASYNLRLFFYLLFHKTDLICSIDLDTILPGFITSKLRKVKRVYDAHELFCEMKEVVERPRIYAVWKRIEQLTVPNYSLGYTVNDYLASEFNRMYTVNYPVIRNMPLQKILPDLPPSTTRYLWYQGAVNEGRCFEQLIPAMQWIDMPLWVAGDGNFMQQAQQLAKDYNVLHKIKFMGMLPPEALFQYAAQAWCGLTLVEGGARNPEFSLANRFFDYIQAGIPQLGMNFLEYKKLNDQYGVALLIEEHSPEIIAEAINNLATDSVLYKKLRENSLLARKELIWEQEEKKLIHFYNAIFND